MTRRTALGTMVAASAAVVFGNPLGRSSLASASVDPPDPIEPIPGLSIRPRAAWAADRPRLATLEPESVEFLLVHHTASTNRYEEPDVVAIIQSVYDFHTGPDKGWPDVAYHFFVDRFGGVWEGRQDTRGSPVRADATGGNQGYAQLACLLGDFTSELPTPAALTSLHLLLAWLGERHDIDTRPGATTDFISRGSNRWEEGTKVVAPTIAGHRDMSATACPGDTFYPYLIESSAHEVTVLRATSSSANTVPNAGEPAGPEMAGTAPDTVAPGTVALDPDHLARPSETSDDDAWMTRAGTIALAGGVGAAALGLLLARLRSTPEHPRPEESR